MCQRFNIDFANFNFWQYWSNVIKQTFVAGNIDQLSLQFYRELGTGCPDMGELDQRMMEEVK